MSLYDALKTHDLRELLRSRGVVIDRSGKTHAAWRNERTPSVQVYEDHWHDYGDPDKRGDLCDWLETAEGMGKAAAREEAARVIGYQEEPGRPHGTTQKGTKRPSDNTYHKPGQRDTTTPSWIHDLVTQAHEALLRGESEAARTAQAYFDKRGLGGLIKALRLGVVDQSVSVPQAGNAMRRYRGRAVIPTLEGGRAVWFKARDISGRSNEALKAAEVNKYDGPSGSVPAPFNPVGLENAAEAGFVVLCEGK